MPRFICATCGTEFADRPAPPDSCPICTDPRQFVGPRGQEWITLDSLTRSHRNAWRAHRPDLFSLETVPSFAIAQRAFLIRRPQGNILWDCLTLLDEASATIIEALGGLTGIAISHPHYYATMVGWADRFDCPIHLHADDRQWVMRPSSRIAFWEGETKELSPGLTLVRCGGHFAGGTVLHWQDGAGGALLSGDILQVAPDKRHISVMRSYPNMLPVSAPAIERIAAALEKLDYASVWGAFTGREILADAKTRVDISLVRYLAAITGDGSMELQ